MPVAGLGSGIGFLVAVLAGVLQVEAELTTETSTLTLYDVTRAKETGPSGVSRSWSRVLQPAGTASDGSVTTFSEEVVEYEMTVSGGATSTFSTTSWEAVRIQSASGYVRIQTGSAFSSIQSCSYASGRGGCMEFVNKFSRVQSSSGQTATTVTSATSGSFLASEATLTPIQTLAVFKAVSVSSTFSSMSPPTPPVISGASSMSNSDDLKTALLGGLLGGAGLILLALGLFLLYRRQRRKNKGEKKSFTPEMAGGGGIGDFDQHQYHYRSSRVTPSMIESSKDGVSIDSSYLPKSHYAKSPPLSPKNSFSTPILPHKYQVPPSPLSSIPYSPEPQTELDSTKGTFTSQSSAVQSTSACSSSRQNTTDSTISHSSSHPGHGFRIHPSRFIEGLSLSSTYLESLMVGGDPETVYQEPNQIEPEDLIENQGCDHQTEHGQSSTSLPGAVTPTPRMNYKHDDLPPQPPSLPSSSTSPRDSPLFATPSQTPNPGMFTASSSSLPPASQSAPHLPYAHPRTPTTPTFLPPSTPRSLVTPSPFSHQSFQTAEEGEDNGVTSTVEDMHPRTAREARSRSQSPSRSHSPSDYSSTDHGGPQYGYVV